MEKEMLGGQEVDSGIPMLEARAIGKDISDENGARHSAYTVHVCVCIYGREWERERKQESSEIRVESQWLSGYLILTAAPQHLTSLAPSNAP